VPRVTARTARTEKEVAEKKEKERESRQLDKWLNLIKWFTSPREGENRMDFGKARTDRQPGWRHPKPGCGCRARQLATEIPQVGINLCVSSS